MNRAIAGLVAGGALLLGAAPALAQHAGHTMPPGMKMDPPKPVPRPAPAPPPRKPATRPAPKPTVRAPAKPPVKRATPAPVAPHVTAPVAAVDHSTMDHSGHDMAGMDMGDDPADTVSRSDAPPMDHGTMDHGAMDHSTTDHGAMTMPMAREPVPTVETPPPPAAGRGPARAADAIWGADAMRASRRDLATENGGGTYSFFMADRAELRARDGRDGYLWDAQGYYGGDIDKLWVKSEGEGAFGEAIEQAELQALWSHAITPWFDAQLGVRQDFAGPDRTHLVAGVQGLAPYLFEIDAAAFLSTRGDLTARVEVELDQRITQRLRLQPRAEVNLAAQDVAELGVGAGLDSAELGLRLRYEIRREFAPYVGVEQEWRTGGSRRFARARGEDASVTNYVAGVRLWF